MKKGILILLSVPLLLVMACSTASCPMDTVVTCNYIFYNADGQPSPLYDTLTLTIAKQVTIYTYRKEGRNDSILRNRSTALIDSGYTETVGKARIDTVLLNRMVNGISMAIPMSYYNSVDTLVLNYGKILLPDTIFLYHTGYTHVETPECGSYRFHNLSSVRTTERCIDHVEILNPTVNYEKQTNIRIYFNTNSE